MMAEEPDDVLSPEQIAAELQDAGIAPTLPNLKALIANARAHEHENRRQWPLLALVPKHVNAEVVRRAADQGLLVAERIGGRWFGTVPDTEAWLRRTGRWFKTEAEEQQWRKMLVNRCRIE
jgi:hypothetical protein